jgi:hypothetical protein
MEAPDIGGGQPPGTLVGRQVCVEAFNGDEQR